ncbi:MAG: hypothetical protein Q4B52_06390 [Tissierellia bacterium]|nr:hypothetical protein [Tissierellia bacterium]
MINNIISTFKNLLDETHTKPNKNLKIYIFDNLKDLQQLIGDNCVDGFFDSMTGNMYMCDEIKFFKHELMHFVMYNWIGWPAALIHEGIAESFCIEESFSNYSNDNMSIEKILNKEIYSKETYYQLGMFFLFIRKKFSLNILKNIYRTIKGPRVLENISILLKLESDILLESFNTWRDSYSNGIC